MLWFIWNAAKAQDQNGITMATKSNQTDTQATEQNFTQSAQEIKGLRGSTGQNKFITG